jgi:cell division protein FtsB
VTATQEPRLLSASARAEPLPDTSEGSVTAPARVPLRVLPSDHLERRARRRRARLTVTVAASLVAVSLLGVVAINVMIAQDQLRLDRLDVQRNAALAHRGQLQLQLAQLQSPARIVAEAEQRLGMVVPSKLTYLSGNGAPVQTTGGGAVPAPLPPPAAPPPAAPAPAAGPAPPTTTPTTPTTPTTTQTTTPPPTTQPPSSNPATVSGPSHP